MIVTKRMPLISLIKWSGHHIVWLSVLVGSIASLYSFNIITLSIPWLPLSVIGTAVAFYVGFKNNQAYDRMWEARKIWGAIVNSSRSWGMAIDGFVTKQFTSENVTDEELKCIKTRLIHRHIAWLYSLRAQLLVPTPWEHISQGGMTAKYAKFYQDRYGVGLVVDEVTDMELKTMLPDEEYDRLLAYHNTATQIINEQSRDLAALRQSNIIDDFRHMQLMEVLRSFYDHQGKCERIKKFPFPRQYANMSRYFVGIFIALLPFSMVPELMKVGPWGLWLSVPITVVVGWIYVMMEVVGDYSENPFQGMSNDIPMLSICRTIEIDLLEMLGETNIPDPIKSKQGILM